MLSKFDDYPIHQTSQPIAQPATGDRNAYDRYWFNGYQDDGEFYFGIGAALYPNLGILDCGLSIVRDGEQHTFHASRRAPQEPTDLQIGPFAIDVLEPMRRIRVTIDENDTGIAADLTFTARTACVRGGAPDPHARPAPRHGRHPLRAVRQVGGRDPLRRHDGPASTRRASTAPRTAAGACEASASPTPASRPPPPGSTQAFFLWAPLHWDDRCTHFGVFEDAHANRWHTDGAVLPVYSSPADIPGAEDPDDRAARRRRARASTTSRARAVPGTRASRCVHADGRREDIDLEPLICFRMKGIGYMHPEWGHGMWKGELAYAGESWKVDDLDPMAFENQHLQQVVRATCGDQVGIGVLEQIAFGPHARYGFKELPRPGLTPTTGVARLPPDAGMQWVRVAADGAVGGGGADGGLDRVAPSAAPRRWVRAIGSVTDATTRNRRSGVVSTMRAQPGR